MRKAIEVAVFSTFILLSGSAAVAYHNIPSAEITLSKHYSGSGIVPTINEYIQYDVLIKNTSDIPITNQSLWVSFTSRGGKTNVYTSFSIQNLLSGDSKLLHLGPFKMREAGEHSLYVGMNRQGNSSLLNEISLNYEPTRPLDTTAVLDGTLVQVIVPLALSLMSGVIAIIAILAYHRKRNRNKK